MAHLLGTFALTMAACVGASAHHSLSATYALDQRTRIEGKVFAVHYRSPHSFLEVEVPATQPGEEPVHYLVEWLSAEGLARQNVEKSTLQVGDTVIVLAQPSRDKQDHRAHLMGIIRPADGWKWGRDVN